MGCSRPAWRFSSEAERNPVGFDSSIQEPGNRLLGATLRYRRQGTVCARFEHHVSSSVISKAKSRVRTKSRRRRSRLKIWIRRWAGLQRTSHNHNFVDVVELFKWAWPHARAEQKKEIAAAIQKILHRCLTESLQPDGSFKHLEVDQSIEEATYFCVEFLSRIGFFDNSQRFWTEQDFPAKRKAFAKKSFHTSHQPGGAAGGSWYRTQSIRSTAERTARINTTKSPAAAS